MVGVCVVCDEDAFGVWRAELAINECTATAGEGEGEGGGGGGSVRAAEC